VEDQRGVVLDDLVLAPDRPVVGLGAGVDVEEVRGLGAGGRSGDDSPLALVLLSKVTQLKYARPRLSKPRAGSLARW
jgi:hypothetical protein